jgi:hypothetical protein
VSLNSETKNVVSACLEFFRILFVDYPIAEELSAEPKINPAQWLNIRTY